MSWILKKKAQSLLDAEEGTVHKDWGGKIAFALVYPNSLLGRYVQPGVPDHLPPAEPAAGRRLRAGVPARCGRHRRAAADPLGAAVAGVSAAADRLPHGGLLGHVRRRLRQRAPPARSRGDSAPARRSPSPRSAGPDGRRVRVLEPRADRAVHGLRRGRRGRGAGRRADRGVPASSTATARPSWGS